MKILFVGLAAALLGAAPAVAQVPGQAVENRVYTYVERMPELPGGGGFQAIVAAIQKQLRYPPLALRNKVEGRVFVSFVVLANGLVSDLKVVKGMGSGLDEAALVAVQQLPRFVPGKQNGQPVAVSYTVPIAFVVGAVPVGPAGTTQPQPAAPTGNDTLQISTYASPMPQLPPAKAAAPATPQAGTRTVMGYGELPTLQSAAQKNVRLPAEVVSGKTEGRVEVRFVVGVSGVVRAVRVARSLSPATDSAAVAAVRQLPRLVPGRNHLGPVAVQAAVSISFFGPNHVYDYVQQQPVFPAPGLPAYLRQHLRVPPVVAAENLDGQLTATFVVRADGRVADPKITTGMCSSCDAEVLRFLKALPAYQPAQLDGHPVAVQQSLYVRMPFEPLDKDSLTRVYTYVEQMPTLEANGGANGGLQAVVEAIQQRLVLPAEVQNGAVAGKTFVSFTVGPRGSVYDAKVVKSLTAACDAAALVAVRKLPRLQGGKQNGRGVAVSFTVPVVFVKPGGATPATK